MKKTYITPTLLTVKVNTTSSLLSASSFGIDSNEGNKITDSNEILVKGQQQGYNVWGDDWSN